MIENTVNQLAQANLNKGMRAALTQKQQDTVPLPIPTRMQPLQEQHPGTNANPKPPRSKNDQNQRPAPTANRTMSVNSRTLTKRIDPTTLNRYSRQSTVPVLANGIAKFPVWHQGARLQKKTQPNPVDGNTIHTNTLAHAQMCQYHADNYNQHIVDGVQVVGGHQSNMGGFQMFVDGEASHGSTTTSGSTGYSDGSLSGDFEDKSDPNFTLLQTKTLIRSFPVTFPATLL
jgi:hypothetical protein